MSDFSFVCFSILYLPVVVTCRSCIRKICGQSSGMLLHYAVAACTAGSPIRPAHIQFERKGTQHLQG
jgi:biotin transporter BioY